MTAYGLLPNALKKQTEKVLWEFELMGANKRLTGFPPALYLTECRLDTFKTSLTKKYMFLCFQLL